MQYLIQKTILLCKKANNVKTSFHELKMFEFCTRRLALFDTFNDVANFTVFGVNQLRIND